MRPARRAEEAGSAWPDRPIGPLIWAHCKDRTAAAQFRRFAARLHMSVPESGFIISSEDAPTDSHMPRVIELGLKDLTQIPGFLAHYRPDLVIWADDLTQRAALDHLRKSGVPYILIDVGAEEFAGTGWGLLRRAKNHLIANADSVICADDAAQNAAERLATGSVSAPGLFEEAGPVLGASEIELEEASVQIGTRPCWLAAYASADEFFIILEAHRQLLSHAHRLLLILVPAERGTDLPLAMQLRDDNWNVALRSEAEDISEATEVLLCDSDEEMGLWYRLAPVCLMASSLTSGHRGKDPYPAAALGTAILYGPHVNGHLASYTKLMHAGAVQLVSNVDTLVRAVRGCLSPEKAATQAHAAWQAITEGAAASDVLLAEVTRILEEREVI